MCYQISLANESSALRPSITRHVDRQTLKLSNRTAVDSSSWEKVYRSVGVLVVAPDRWKRE